MNKHIYYIAALFMMLQAGCNDTESTDQLPDGREVKVTATLGTSATRALTTTDENSLKLTTRWQVIDQIAVYVANADGTIFLGNVPIRDISADGRTATFSYKLPDDFLNNTAGSYRLMCFTGYCYPTLSEQFPYYNLLYYNASLRRQKLSDFRVPLFFDGTVEGEDPSVCFQTYGVYEVLHVANLTDKDITFSLIGYEANPVWYRMKGAIRLNDGSYDLNYEGAQPPVDKSEAVTIPAQQSECILSWYMPNGNKINEAKVVAEINGNSIHSTNSKNSDVTLRSGHAYHIYVSWDGEKLTFDNGDIVYCEEGLFINNMGGEDL